MNTTLETIYTNLTVQVNSQGFLEVQDVLREFAHESIFKNCSLVYTAWASSLLTGLLLHPTLYYTLKARFWYRHTGLKTIGWALYISVNGISVLSWNVWYTRMSWFSFKPFSLES